MPRDLEYLEEAVAEAEAAARWYASRSAAAAVGFSAELDEAETAIAAWPDAWPPYRHGTRHYLLRRYPYSVVYRVDQHRILVVHGRRRPGYWRTRMHAPS